MTRVRSSQLWRYICLNWPVNKVHTRNRSWLHEEKISHTSVWLARYTGGSLLHQDVLQTFHAGVTQKPVKNNFIVISFKSLWCGSLKLIDVQNKVQNQNLRLSICRFKIMMLLINVIHLQNVQNFNSIKTYVRSNSSFFWSSQ